MKIEATPFPELLTDRLVLRRLVMADNKRLCELRSDESVNRYLDRPKTLGPEESEAFVKKIDGYLDDNKSLYWILSLKNSTDLIGTICLWNFIPEREMADIGYELMPAFQGQGLMQEAVEKVIEYGFNVVGLKVITGLIHLQNKASKAVLERVGFKADLDYSYVSKEESGADVVYYKLKA